VEKTTANRMWIGDMFTLCVLLGKNSAERGASKDLVRRGSRIIVETAAVSRPFSRKLE